MIVKYVFSSGSNVSLRNIAILLAGAPIFSFFFFYYLLKNTGNLKLDEYYHHVPGIMITCTVTRGVVVIAMAVMLRAENVI